MKHALVQRYVNNSENSALYLCQDKSEEGGNAVALLTDDNAVLAQIADAVFTAICTMLY